MNWHHIFSFVALLGFSGAHHFRGHTSHRHTPMGVIQYPVHNSFPYTEWRLNEKPDRDLFTSTIVSSTTGLLCSGFHIAPEIVVTAASCVYRANGVTFYVISHDIRNTTDIGGPANKYHYFSVVDIKYHANYEPATDRHNIALLFLSVNVTDPKEPGMPLLSLPNLNSNSRKPETYFVKYGFDEENQSFYSKKIYANVMVNLNECGNENSNIPPRIFFCVGRTDSRPYSYGLRDLGTPLIYQTNGKSYVMGMFTGHDYNSKRSRYLYQDLMGNYEFLSTVI